MTLTLRRGCSPPFSFQQLSAGLIRQLPGRTAREFIDRSIPDTKLSQTRRATSRKTCPELAVLHLCRSDESGLFPFPPATEAQRGRTGKRLKSGFPCSCRFLSGRNRPRRSPTIGRTVFAGSKRTRLSWLGLSSVCFDRRPCSSLLFIEGRRGSRALHPNAISCLIRLYGRWLGKNKLIWRE